MLNKRVEDEIQRKLSTAVKLLRKLQREDLAEDLEATAHAIEMEFEEEDAEYKQKYGFSHREVEL